MRAALFRNIAIVMFTKRGKKVITLCGALLLCFISTLLLDWRLYLSATLTGTLAAATLTVFAVQHFRQRHYKREREQRRVVYEREREQRKVAKATRRIETAKARHEKFERAKASLAGAATGLSSGAAGFASMAKTGASNGAAAVARVAKISLTGVRRLGSWRSKVAPGAAFVTDASGTTTLLPGIPIFETPPAQASGDAVQWVPDRQREQMFGAKQQVPHGGQCD